MILKGEQRHSEIHRKSEKKEGLLVPEIERIYLQDYQLVVKVGIATSHRSESK